MKKFVKRWSMTSIQKLVKKLQIDVRTSVNASLTSLYDAYSKRRFIRRSILYRYFMISHNVFLTSITAWLCLDDIAKQQRDRRVDDGGRVRRG